MNLGFELKRLWREKIYIYFVVFFIMIYVLSFLESNNIFIVDFYNAFTQLFTLLTIPFISYSLSKDFEDGVDYFYFNNGKKLQNWYIKRVISIMISLIILNIVYQIISKLAFGFTLWESIFLIIVTSCLNIYMILLASIIGISTQKKLESVFSSLIMIFILSTINFINIPYIQGNIFLIDQNSKVTQTIANILNSKTNNHLLPISIILLWDIILVFVLFLILKLKENRKWE